VIERRLRAVASAGLVIALYNPISRARPWQLGAAFAILREVLPWTTPVIFGRAAGRPDEAIGITTLSEANAAHADMATCVIIGSAETRIITRPGRQPLVYSPRSSGVSQ
jgi:precorrin-3B C17-methyltransferase